MDFSGLKPLKLTLATHSDPIDAVYKRVEKIGANELDRPNKLERVRSLDEAKFIGFKDWNFEYNLFDINDARREPLVSERRK